MPIRIGAVSYANTRPLVYGLAQRSDVVLSFDVPSGLAAKLRNGEIDVGLVPIVEYLRGVGDQIVPGICIASDGPVRTVKLFSRLAPARLSDVGVDSASRTSVALLRILLAERYGITPDFHTHAADLRRMLTIYEAALLIGDAAFTDSGAPYVWDLGQGWRELTGLPFVYATWVARAGVDPEVTTWLQESLILGLRHIDDIVRESPTIVGVDAHGLHRYLSETLHYSLGAAERRGIETFQKHCLRYNIIPTTRELCFAAPLARQPVSPAK